MSWGGYFGHIARVLSPRNLAHNIKKLIHNPEAAILPAHTRNSTLWHKYGRPAEKIVAAVAVGAATAGAGTIAAAAAGYAGAATFGTVATSTFVAGGISAGVGSALTGGLSSKAFQPMHDLIVPAGTGFVTGALSGTVKSAYSKTELAKKGVYTTVKSVASNSIKTELARNVAKYTSAQYLGAQAAKLITQQKHTPTTATNYKRYAVNTQHPTATPTATKGSFAAVLSGVAIGGVTAGPIGALVGAGVGAMIGKKKNG